MCDGWKWKEWCGKVKDSRRAELGKKQGICVRLFCLEKEDGDTQAKGLDGSWAAQVVFPRKLERRS